MLWMYTLLQGAYVMPRPTSRSERWSAIRYYDDTIDESMTELMSDYVNSGSLYNVMDMAIAYGINPYIYTSAHEGEEGYVSGSDVP